MSQRLIGVAYLLAWRLIRVLPERVAYALFDHIALRVARRRGRGLRQLERNLARAVHDPGRVAVEGMRAYARYWCDVFRLPSWSRERITSTVVVHGREHIDTALANGGAVAALPHLGNWDHAGAWANWNLAPVWTIAERLQPTSLFDRFIAFRTQLGMHVFAHDDPQAIPALVDALKAGAFVALVADRDLGGRGIPVTLLGEAATLPTGPLRLAAQAGVPLIPVYTWRDAGTLHVQVEPPIPLDDLTGAAQALADVFSRAILAHPHEWHVLARVFTADRQSGLSDRERE